MELYHSPRRAKRTEALKAWLGHMCETPLDCGCVVASEGVEGVDRRRRSAVRRHLMALTLRYQAHQGSKTKHPNPGSVKTRPVNPMEKLFAG